MYEQYEKGNINTENIVNWFEEQEVVNELSWILAYDFEINEVKKCVDDVVNTYLKERMLKERNEIIKQLERNDLGREESEQLENMLNEIIIKLAKIK